MLPLRLFDAEVLWQMVVVTRRRRRRRRGGGKS
jgi:hypothetical protein